MQEYSFILYTRSFSIIRLLAGIIIAVLPLILSLIWVFNEGLSGRLR
jgi:hypothetical protein